MEIVKFVIFEQSRANRLRFLFLIPTERADAIFDDLHVHAIAFSRRPNLQNIDPHARPESKT